MVVVAVVEVVMGSGGGGGAESGGRTQKQELHLCVGFFRRDSDKSSFIRGRSFDQGLPSSRSRWLDVFKDHRPSKHISAC